MPPLVPDFVPFLITFGITIYIAIRQMSRNQLTYLKWICFGMYIVLIISYLALQLAPYSYQYFSFSFLVSSTYSIHWYVPLLAPIYIFINRRVSRISQVSGVLFPLLFYTFALVIPIKFYSILKDLNFVSTIIYDCSLVFLSVVLYYYTFIYNSKADFYAPQPKIQLNINFSSKTKFVILLSFLFYFLITWVSSSDIFDVLKSLEFVLILPALTILAFVLLISRQNYSNFILWIGVLIPILAFIFNTFIISSFQKMDEYLILLFQEFMKLLF